MLFLLHVVLLIYGLAAMVIGKFRTSSAWDAADARFYELVDKFFPESVFQPYKLNVSETVHQPQRSYLIGGALVAYSLRYLFSRHRG
jgi:hypothetical protein